MSESVVPDDARALDRDRDRYLRELAAHRRRPEHRSKGAAAIDEWIRGIDPATRTAARLMFGVLVATVGLRIAAGW